MNAWNKQLRVYVLSLLFLLELVLAVPSNTLVFEHSTSELLVHDEHLSNDQGSFWSNFLQAARHKLFRSNTDVTGIVDQRAYTPGPRQTKLPAGYSAHANEVVIRFNLTTAEEATSLAEASNTLFLDIWNIATNHVDIRLGNNDLAPLLGLLPESLQHAHMPLMQGRDLANAVADTFPTSPRGHFAQDFQPRRSFTPIIRPTETNEFFREYRPLSVIISWMRLLQSLFPSHVRLISVGKSWEGRDIYALRIEVHPTNQDTTLGPRKTILVTGGSHAREWISTSTVNYVMYNFIVGYGRDSDITTLLEQFDFVFIPTLNPDGFVYSWKYDRLWRKTRQPSPIPFCHGIDIDRSWSYEWAADQQGQSPNPCSENYAGEEPFHSVEARTFAEWMRNETISNKTAVIGLVDLHSYSQSILVPYAYSCADLPPNFEDLEEFGLGMSRAIKRTNGEYFEVIGACQGNVVRSTGTQIQSSGGSPLDWFHHNMNVKYSYQIKLRDTGSYGFLLPPEYIDPSGREVFNAVMFLARSLTSDDSIMNAPALVESVRIEAPADL